MPILTLLISTFLSASSVTITDPIDGKTYDGDWLPLKVIVENENELPDSVHYALNGNPVVQIPRLNTDWPTYMQNFQNHGYSESPAPFDNTVLWSAEVTGYVHQFPTPVTSDGVVYYPQDDSGADSTLYALDAATGAILWQQDTGAADDAVTIFGDYLYYSTYTVLCLNKYTGETVWSSYLGNASGGTPVINGNRIYCGKTISYNPKTSIISCLDRTTGNYMWSDTVSGELGSCMAYQDSLLIVPLCEGSLLAYGGVSGEIVWQNGDAVLGYWDSSPVIVDGAIYINDWYERTYAFDLYSGNQIWEQATGGGTATIAYHDERLFFGTEFIGSYYCLDATDGSSIWSVPGHQHGSSGIADGLVFFGEDTSVNDSSRVVALYCETGAEIWSYKTYSGGSANGFQGSPSITDGVMYYPCTDGYLYAFGTGLKYSYKDDSFYADVGANELIVTSWDDGVAVAADTINFTVTGTGISLEPTHRLSLCASPNPFHSSASISFELSEPGWTCVTVYELSGRMVRTLENSELGVGQHSIIWDGRRENGEVVSAGLYLCRIQSGEISETIGLCLLR